MNEKIKSFFEKVGLCLSALFLFVLGLLVRNCFQNKGKRVEPDSAGNGKLDENRERAEQSALTITEIIQRVKERGGEREEESPAL
ncbi:hypothetical protein DYE50_01455 [Treponema ruminis]|uniref:Uncharacterized protein n=1 Tax=Treponema ruminis TaxID=744515 RepID=A0A7W8GBP8_9SPIR|nr:hypothetical protein [Treponema ruminis]MBB5227443.1 hypothetical protein [Treponema ruminis]QSI01250.1 hypothetical protein DYE50_01455 [Treponema ruminis]